MPDLRPVTRGRLRVVPLRLRLAKPLTVPTRRRRVLTHGVPTVLARRPRGLRLTAVQHIYIRNWSHGSLVKRVTLAHTGGPVSIVTIDTGGPVSIVTIRPERAVAGPISTVTDLRRTTILKARTLQTTTLVASRAERVEPGPAGARGEAGPTGATGRPGPTGVPPVTPAMTLATAGAAGYPAPQAIVRAAPHSSFTPPARAPSASPTAADLDALTTQVIRRIERRAIAQRERMGDR